MSIYDHIRNVKDQSSRRSGNGRGFGSVDAAYRRVTGRRRQKPKIETSYYAMLKQAMNKRK